MSGAGIPTCDSTKRALSATLETLAFDNESLRTLPVDKEPRNFVRKVSGVTFSRCKQTPMTNPVTVAVCHEAMALLDLPPEQCERKELAEYLAGNKVLENSDPAAHCYCGFQFGHFAGQLGDGAAIMLGEVVNSRGERWQIQVKGGGKTPYSRTADGRKVLRSSLREFLCSEAMHALGIPTTRAGALITSDTMIDRDQFYSGDVKPERASVVLRIARSFIRFGSFDVFRLAEFRDCKEELLAKLIDHVAPLYPEVTEVHGEANTPQRNLAIFKQIVQRTARMVAAWQCVGFCHGVLNTDNLNIAGDTIDYGPFGFMDRFDPDFICNASDNNGRYSYAKQPEMCRWNCGKLFETWSPAMPEGTEAEAVLKENFDAPYEAAYMHTMRRKLGLRRELAEDATLVSKLLAVMRTTGADFTNTFRGLARVAIPEPATGASGAGEESKGSDGAGEEESDDDSDALPALPEATQAFMDDLLPILPTPKLMAIKFKPEVPPAQLQQLLHELQNNPLSGLRRYAPFLQQQLDLTKKYQALISESAEDKRERDEVAWNAWLAQYGERLAKEVEAGQDVAEVQAKRLEVMNSTNPRFVLRNYIAQKAIELAEAGDYAEVNRLLKVLQHPFSGDEELAKEADVEVEMPARYSLQPPPAMLDLKVT